MCDRLTGSGLDKWCDRIVDTYEWKMGMALDSQAPFSGWWTEATVSDLIDEEPIRDPFRDLGGSRNGTHQARKSFARVLGSTVEATVNVLNESGSGASDDAVTRAFESVRDDRPEAMAVLRNDPEAIDAIKVVAQRGVRALDRIDSEGNRRTQVTIDMRRARNVPQAEGHIDYVCDNAKGIALIDLKNSTAYSMRFEQRVAEMLAYGVAWLANNANGDRRYARLFNALIIVNPRVDQVKWITLRQLAHNAYRVTTLARLMGYDEATIAKIEQTLQRVRNASVR